MRLFRIPDLDGPNVITRQQLEDQIASLQAQQENARQIIERCEGGLQVCRSWLGKVMREEDEAKAAAEANGAAAVEVPKA